MPATVAQYSIQPLGDRALVVEVGVTVSAAVATHVRRLSERILTARIPGVRDVVPAFCSLTIHYDPLQFALADASPFDTVGAAIRALLEEAATSGERAGRLVEIPVCYGDRYGEDLEAIASAHEMSTASVIELHTAPTYFVGMLGFAPGFAYLGGLDPRLVTPRRATPRPNVPRGSVAIGGEHTGIYPVDSPGGWHLIGRTPLALFDLGRDCPSLLEVGDEVRFVAISPESFTRIETQGRWP